MASCGTCPWEESETPTIDSFTLSSDQVIRGEIIDLNLEVSFFELRGPEGHSHEDGSSHEHESTAACPGGHWHLYLDDLFTNPVAQSINEAVAFEIPADTALGNHTFIARLHNENHSILHVAGEEVSAQIDFEVVELEGLGR